MLAVPVTLAVLVAAAVSAPEGPEEPAPAPSCPRGLEPSFYCPIADRCIDTSRVCDGILDCWDRQDEADCPACVSGALACDASNSSGGAVARFRCVAAVHLCDGHEDCADGRDEEGCPSPLPDLYTCASGLTRRREVVCDGIQDCDRPLDDEGDCSECRRDAVLCGGICVPAAQRCDGVRDCEAHGEDEEGCDDHGRFASSTPSQAGTATMSAVAVAGHSDVVYFVGGALLILLLVLAAALVVFWLFRGRLRRGSYGTQLDRFGESRAWDNAMYGVEAPDAPENEYEDPDAELTLGRPLRL